MMRVCPDPQFAALPTEEELARRNAPAVHFIGFRGEEYWSAVRVWGPPGFIHMGWDRRAQRDIADGDVVVFARGDADQPIGPYNFPDTKEVLP